MPKTPYVDFTKVRIGRSAQPLGSAGPKPTSPAHANSQKGVQPQSPAGPKPSQKPQPSAGERKP